MPGMRRRDFVALLGGAASELIAFLGGALGPGSTCRIPRTATDASTFGSHLTPPDVEQPKARSGYIYRYLIRSPLRRNEIEAILTIVGSARSRHLAVHLG
jgi:hypothetical protein